MRASLLLQRGHGKHRLTVELVSHSMAVGSGTRQPHGAPSPGLLPAAADPRLSPHSGKPMAGCHLMEMLKDLVPLFLGLDMAVGACRSPLMGQRTSGLLNGLIARCLKEPKGNDMNIPCMLGFALKHYFFQKLALTTHLEVA